VGPSYTRNCAMALPPGPIFVVHGLTITHGLLTRVGARVMRVNKAGEMLLA